jgi:hypothetical protein
MNHIYDANTPPTECDDDVIGIVRQRVHTAIPIRLSGWHHALYIAPSDTSNHHNSDSDRTPRLSVIIPSIASSYSKGGSYLCPSIISAPLHAGTILNYDDSDIYGIIRTMVDMVLVTPYVSSTMIPLDAAMIVTDGTAMMQAIVAVSATLPLTLRSFIVLGIAMHHRLTDVALVYATCYQGLLDHVEVWNDHHHIPTEIDPLHIAAVILARLSQPFMCMTCGHFHHATRNEHDIVPRRHAS